MSKYFEESDVKGRKQSIIIENDECSIEFTKKEAIDLAETILKIYNVERHYPSQE